MILEEWKDVDGLEGEYAVSTMGRVKNLKNGRILDGGYNNDGYRRIKLKGKYYEIHRLVALAFLDNPHNLPQVNHIDEKKDNNNVSNLEWCTASQNQRHSAHQKSCRINQLTLDGQFIRQWESSHQIERETGYHATHIIKCCKRKRKQAYGYKWQYTDGLNQQRSKRPVAALTKDGEFVAEYKSAAEAARFLKISTTQIYYCLNGTCKSAHGLRFIYID